MIQAKFSLAEAKQFEEAFDEIFSSVTSGGSGIDAYMTHSRAWYEQHCMLPRFFKIWKRASFRSNCSMQRYLKLKGGTGAIQGANSDEESVASDNESKRSDADYEPDPADGDTSEEESSNILVDGDSKVRMGQWTAVKNDWRQLFESGQLNTLIRTILGYAQQRNVNETKNFGYQPDAPDTAEQGLSAAVANIGDDRDFYGVNTRLVTECDFRSHSFCYLQMNRGYICHQKQ
jgi:hypothetical protein